MQAIRRRFGDSIVVVPRWDLVDLLASELPARAARTGTTVICVSQSGDGPVRVRTDRGDREADLVVAADGLHSRLRQELFPGHPGALRGLHRVAAR